MSCAGGGCEHRVLASQPSIPFSYHSLQACLCNRCGSALYDNHKRNRVSAEPAKDEQVGGRLAGGRSPQPAACRHSALSTQAASALVGRPLQVVEERRCTHCQATETTMWRRWGAWRTLRFLPGRCAAGASPNMVPHPPAWDPMQAPRHPQPALQQLRPLCAQARRAASAGGPGGGGGSRGAGRGCGSGISSSRGARSSSVP